MSRTIRRKNGKKHWRYGLDLKIDEYGKYEWFPLEGKELKKQLAKLHGDHGYTTYTGCGSGPGIWFRKKEQHKYRRKAKRELIRFKQDSEYEVQIQARPYLPYWD